MKTKLILFLVLCGLALFAGGCVVVPGDGYHHHDDWGWHHDDHWHE